MKVLCYINRWTETEAIILSAHDIDEAVELCGYWINEVLIEWDADRIINDIDDDIEYDNIPHIFEIKDTYLDADELTIILNDIGLDNFIDEYCLEEI